jgi:hypothetical protein
MKIYLASRYSRLLEMQGIRTQLEGIGDVVVSRWIEGKHKLNDAGNSSEVIRFAEEDWVDLNTSDCVISFTEMPRTFHSRGGRHVEFGIALAAGKRLIVVGPRENVFHWLPQVSVYEIWHDCFVALDGVDYIHMAGNRTGFWMTGDL